jgi:hypothetical protein
MAPGGIDVFSHKIDPLVQIELNKIFEWQRKTGTIIADIIVRLPALREDLAAIELKLDELLAKPAERSIPGEEPEPEKLDIGPGRKTFTQRKRERERNSASPGFIDKVRNGAAVTESKTKEV